MTVGKNDHAAWWIELEPEAAGSRDMEIATKSLIVGARLQERSFEIGNLVEIGAYPANRSICVLPSACPVSAAVALVGADRLTS